MNIYKGYWNSALPIDGLQTGLNLLFDDPRIKELNNLYPVRGKDILELGPLECGHTYMLNNFGAASITSVEANSNNYLKCLIVKDIFSLNSKLLFGDFREYLRNCKMNYDVIVACGVLYHMTEPTVLISDICKLTNTVFLQTHYYDENHNASRPNFEGGMQMIDDCYEAHKYIYGGVRKTIGFCGGTKSYSMWLTKDSIFKALKDNGFGDVTVVQDDNTHPNGSNMTLLVNRS